MKKLIECFSGIKKILLEQDTFAEGEEEGNEEENEEEDEEGEEGGSESDLPKEEIQAKILEFFKENPYPEDDKVHELAKGLGMEPDDFETHIYAVLSGLLKDQGEEEPKDEEPSEDEPTDEPSEELVDEPVEEEVKLSKETEAAVYELMSNVIAVGLAQVEQVMNQEFESVAEAERFLQDLFRKYRTNARQYLMQSLRRFERQGAKRVSREFRRTMEI